MNLEPSDPVVIELQNQLEKKRAILSNKGLINKVELIYLLIKIAA